MLLMACLQLKLVTTSTLFFLLNKFLIDLRFQQVMYNLECKRDIYFIKKWELTNKRNIYIHCTSMKNKRKDKSVINKGVWYYGFGV